MPAPPITLYVAYSLDGGGAERLLTNIILQQNAPTRISVVSLRPGGIFRATLENAGVTVTDLGMTNYHHAFRGVFQLAALMRARRPEVVHGWDYFSNLLAFVALHLVRLPARIFWAAFCTDFGTQKLKLRFRAAMRLNVLLSSRVDGVIYNGVEVRDFHHGIGFRERRTVVISNAIDANAFRHDPAMRDSMREQLGIAPDDVVVAVVARVDVMKDWPSICEAVRDLPGVVTVAVGAGTNALPPQAGLIQLGWRDDVVSVLSAADIFLLGSAFGEGTSLAVGEAMLCGLPCIVTDVGGNGALVGDSGIVVEPRNVNAMRQAVIDLACDRERRTTLGRLARTRAASATSRDDGVPRLHVLGLAEAGT
jgi:glycosyltransferase involved in cell wall biosynthesis